MANETRHVCGNCFWFESDGNSKYIGMTERGFCTSKRSKVGQGTYILNPYEDISCKAWDMNVELMKKELMEFYKEVEAKEIAESQEEESYYDILAMVIEDGKPLEERVITYNFEEFNKFLHSEEFHIIKEFEIGEKLDWENYDEDDDEDDDDYVCPPERILTLVSADINDNIPCDENNLLDKVKGNILFIAESSDGITDLSDIQKDWLREHFLR